MAKDARVLREEAAAATSAGKYKRALAAYLELERLEPRDAQWAKRAAETYRKLGNTKNAIEAFVRSAERYAQNGFLVQAIAVCKLILQIDPQHDETLRRLAQMNELSTTGPTRAASMAENNPSLHEIPNVLAIRRANTTLSPVEAARRKKHSTPPIVAVPRTKSKPIQLDPGAALESVSLQKEVPESRPHNDSTPGVHLIPLSDEFDVEVDTDYGPIVEVEAPDDATYEADFDDATELEFGDIEEIPLPEPRAIGQIARRALAATPLFAGLPSEALESLVEHLQLVPLEAGQVLFYEGDPGDALYVIVEGEVSVAAEGPPRVEMARLGPGSFIGEVALMTDQPRSATVSATVPTELLRIDRVTMSHVLSAHGDVLRAVLRFVRDRLVDRWMRTSPLFRPFSAEERAALADKFNFLEIDAGTKMIAMGSRPDGLYIILAGRFAVIRANATLATLGAGDLIGETALLSGGTIKSDVVAINKGLALCLPASDFREVNMTHPHVLEYIGEQAEHSRRLQIL
jgi:CRP-like cAMP-binding protein